MSYTYEKIFDYENLELAFNKAKKGKRGKLYVLEFEAELEKNLQKLQEELKSQRYTPKPLETFILRDPKTRKISKSAFRDRVIHHAICNVIEPLFDKTFIFDSYANRIGKGTFKAIKRFDYFKRKVSKNNTRRCFVLKADVKHYFDTVKHDILLNQIRKKIADKRVIELIEKILANHSVKERGRGMPLGNLTSQFFANIYLNELDKFVKYNLKVKYYIRYVDDFVILHNNPKILTEYKESIDLFIKEQLHLDLHPDKCNICTLEEGIDFLGFRIFYHHKLIRRKNLFKFERKFNSLKEEYKEGLIDREKIVEKFEGWLTYSSQANTYKYRRHLIINFNKYFPITAVDKVKNAKKNQNFNKKIETSHIEYSSLKTLKLYRKGLTINQITERRQIKEGTIWQHLATLIQNNQLSVWSVLPKQKINKISTKIRTEHDRLKDIKNRIEDKAITYDEINCVLASIKAKKKEKSIYELVNWYKKVHCRRKCYNNPQQRKICQAKFNDLTRKCPELKIKRKDFLRLFNNHMNICVLPDKQKRKYMTWKEFRTKIMSLKKIQSVKVNNITISERQ